jgi:hypothetical protein
VVVLERQEQNAREAGREMLANAVCATLVIADVMPTNSQRS